MAIGGILAGAKLLHNLVNCLLDNLDLLLNELDLLNQQTQLKRESIQSQSNAESAFSQGLNLFSSFFTEAAARMFFKKAALTSNSTLLVTRGIQQAVSTTCSFESSRMGGASLCLTRQHASQDVDRTPPCFYENIYIRVAPGFLCGCQGSSLLAWS